MKKSLFIVMFFLSLNSFSQNVQEYIWCQIEGVKKGVTGTKMKVDFDFGKHTQFFFENVLIDEKGKTLEFETMIDALNYMEKKGWKFIQAYSALMGNANISFNFYLLKIPIAELDEKTKQEYINKNDYQESRPKPLSLSEKDESV